jgi:hypothetical protein
MSSPMTIACTFHIDRRGKGRRGLREGQPTTSGTLERIVRFPCPRRGAAAGGPGRGVKFVPEGTPTTDMGGGLHK